MGSYPNAMWLFGTDSKRAASWIRLGVVSGLISAMLGLAPFAVAQDVHHELAAADSDGHEHSDTDICQWVQHHTAGSVDYDVPTLVVSESVCEQQLPCDSIILSAAPSLVGPSRAPPSR
ncbi:MAG: hypothetical protein IPM58_17445 [Nitrospira sp.]|nr:hypothetical protein [Nitrospira sp.]